MTREKDKWRPSPAVVGAFKKDIAKEASSMRLTIAGKPRTWKWVLGQVQKGTKFGRAYYAELEKGSDTRGP